MDKAHKDTDRALADLERRVQKVYADALNDVQAKLDDFVRRFKAKDAIHRKELAAGKITKEQYQSWLRGQVFQGRQWQAKLDQLAFTLTNADKVAQGIINGSLDGVFANNANWISFTLEHGVGVNFGFDAYDSATVARLLRDQPELLPKYDLDIPRDMLWNQQIISQQITQGIIQGENIFQVAARIAAATDRDMKLSLTRARTAMTGAQNAGRQESLDRAERMGIRVEKEWLATLDGHTRDQHRRLDGKHVPVKSNFVIDGDEIEYPGDPKAKPYLVYNCRCTMIGRLVEYPPEYNTKRYDNIDGVPVANMTYPQWYEAKTGHPM